MTSEAVQVAPEKWLRKPGIGTPVTVAFLVANSLAYGVMGGLAMAKFPPGEPFLATVAAVLFFGWLVGASVWLTARVARAGLRISARGVSVRGVFRTRVIPLTEVERLEADVNASAVLRSELRVMVVRRNGSRLPVWALRKGVYSTKTSVDEGIASMQPLCNRLNELLRETRGDSDETTTRGDASEEHPTRAEADKAYRTMRAIVILSALCFLAIGVVIAILDFSGWQIYLGGVILVEGICTPVFLYTYRRELNEKVRHGEEALGKADAGR